MKIEKLMPDELNTKLAIILCRFRAVLQGPEDGSGPLSTRMNDGDMKTVGAWIDKSRDNPFTEDFANWLLSLAREDVERVAAEKHEKDHPPTSPLMGSPASRSYPWD